MQVIFKSYMTLSEKIKKGESRTLEFKVDFPEGNQLSRSVVAFANGAGGEILIGVDDKGFVKGLAEDQINNYPDRIAASISDSCNPLIVPDIFRTTIENKSVIIIKIYPGSAKPYYLKNTGIDKGTYVRIGAINKIADNNVIRELERQRNNISFDEEINYRYEIADFDLNKFSADFEKYANKKITNVDMFNFKLFVNENNKEYLSNGAVILNGLEDKAKVKCARFKGNEMGEFIDRKEFSGMLYDVVESVIAFIKNHISLKGVIEDLHRDDTYEVPLIALREAVINAIVHRDYTIESDIKVAIYDDMIEIMSPGVLPGSITIDQIDEGRSEIRNKIISRIFKEFNLIEQWGIGITKIIKSCESYGLKKPLFIEKGGFFSVEIYRDRPNTDRIPTANRPQTDLKTALVMDFTEQELKIIEFLKQNARMERSDVMELLEIKETRAKELLSVLINKGTIERKGTGKSSFYILT